MTLVGPHREDITLLLGGMPVKYFASARRELVFALALKLASWFVHVEDDSSVGSSPILILDDVFAELDSARRHRLGAMVADAEQVLITCAVLSDIPEELGDYRLVSVTAGARRVCAAAPTRHWLWGSRTRPLLRSRRMTAMSNPVRPQNHVSRETFGEFAESQFAEPQNPHARLTAWLSSTVTGGCPLRPTNPYASGGSRTRRGAPGMPSRRIKSCAILVQ